MLIGSSENNSTLLMVISIPSRTIKRFTIPDFDEFVSGPLWSPDSRYIAITGSAMPPQSPTYTVSISLYGIDGTILPDVIRNAAGALYCGVDYCDGHDPYVWSADGQAIFYVQNTPYQGFNALAYDVYTHQTQRLAENISDFPVYRSDDHYALIQWWEQNKIYAGILNLATKKRITLDSHPLSALSADLKWLGDKALVRWDNSLVWANADSTDRHNLSVAPEQLRNGPTTTQRPSAGQYGWSTDGHWLLVTTQFEDTSNRYSENVWLIDLTNGKTTTFPHMEVASPIDGQFISPDNKVALLRNYDEDRLYLVNLTDGTLHQATIDPSELVSVYQIVWIPHSDVIAVVPSGDYYPDLYLIRRDGTQIAHYTNFPDLGDPPSFYVQWATCLSR
jgi:hypothetical protein